MERRVILSAALAHGATHSLELMFAALLLRIGLEFGADLAALGAIVNIGTFTFGATALPSGYLSDRFGPRAVLTASMGGAAVCAGLVALSPNLPLLTVSLALLGAAIGLYHPAGVAMVSTVTRRRGLAFAAHGIAGNLGVALAPAVGIGIAIGFGWRASYLALMVLAIVVAVIVYRIAPAKDELAQAAARGAAEAGAPGQPNTTPPLKRSWFAPPLLLIFGCAVAMGFIYRGSLTFLPAHLERNLGFSVFGWTPEAVAGAAASLVLLAGVFGQMFGGALSDRIAVERAALPIVLINAPILALMASAHGVSLMIFAAGFVLMNFALQPVFNGLIADYAPEGGRGRAFGISFFMTFGLGSFAGSIAGTVADRAGTEAMFLMLSGVGVALAVAMVVVAGGAERRRRALIAARSTGVAAGG